MFNAFSGKNTQNHYNLALFLLQGLGYKECAAVDIKKDFGVNTFKSVSVIKSIKIITYAFLMIYVPMIYFLI